MCKVMSGVVLWNTQHRINDFYSLGDHKFIDINNIIH